MAADKPNQVLGRPRLQASKACQFLVRIKRLSGLNGLMSAARSQLPNREISPASLGSAFRPGSREEDEAVWFRDLGKGLMKSSLRFTCDVLDEVNFLSILKSY